MMNYPETICGVSSSVLARHSVLDTESSRVLWIPASAGMTNSRQAAGNEPPVDSRWQYRTFGSDWQQANERLWLSHEASEPATAIGSVKRTVVPWFNWLSMTSSPPCALTRCFTMAKPSPVPPISRERALSTR